MASIEDKTWKESIKAKTEMVSASHKSVGLNTQWQTTAIRGSGILVQSIFREKKLNKKEKSSYWSKDFWVRLGLKSNPKCRKILAKFLKVWEQFGQVDNPETTANMKRWLSVNCNKHHSRKQKPVEQMMYILAYLFSFYFLARLWNGSPDIRLHCNFLLHKKFTVSYLS